MANEIATSGLESPARVLPVLRTVSRDAQVHLSGTRPPRTQMADPSVKGAWRKGITESSIALSRIVQTEAPPFKADIKTTELSRCVFYQITPRIAMGSGQIPRCISSTTAVSSSTAASRQTLPTCRLRLGSGRRLLCCQLHAVR